MNSVTRKELERALSKGKISQAFFDSEIIKIQQQDLEQAKTRQSELDRASDELPNRMSLRSDGHLEIDLICARCGHTGVNSVDERGFELLGKDREGFIYFECPDCREHLQFDTLSGEIKTRKGILGFFGRFS